MTRRQAEALAFITDFIEREGFSPSYAEIAAGLGMKSMESVYRVVHALADAGKIRHRPGRARSIELVKDAA